MPQFYSLKILTILVHFYIVHSLQIVFLFFQVVCSICEIVEACTSDIKSGWRPLFGALRSIRVQYTADESVNEARQLHIMAVLDVFDVFLNTDNLLAFANAGVDCIQCLLKYVTGPGT